MLAVSYPRERRLVRMLAALENGLLALAPKRFRTIVHDPQELAAAARSAGFHPVRTHRSAVWEAVAFSA